ncbi:hypothetical protein, partial [Streptomyces sp. NPDC060188]|uniref:hypothetical protein n=1 Tax=Streptomyces sp. NPDC060188 TaxID=3347068 RepID=UPI0036507C06
QLGWLNYDTAKAGKQSTHKLGIAEYNTWNKQGRSIFSASASSCRKAYAWVSAIVAGPPCTGADDKTYETSRRRR